MKISQMIFQHIKKSAVIISGLVLLSFQGLAQETNCTNGIDDDGDGLIDCYDDDCYGSGPCADFYYGQNTPTCFNPPAVLPTFELEEVFRTDNQNHGFDQRSGVMVGDMDGDGAAELVTHDRTEDVILIFNGVDGSIKQTINQNEGAHQFSMVALGDVDGDGLGDIFTTEGGNSSSRVRRYEFSAGGDQGGSTNAIFTTVDLVGTRVNYSSPQLADFDEDGSPEVYVGANIFNAETGALVAQDNTINSGWLNTGTNNGDRLPLAYNIFNDGDAKPAGAGGGTFGSEADGLEFIAGNQVYTVDGGGFQLAAEITGSNLGDGFVSLGDLDNDNAVDIIVTSEGYIYAWNPRTETQIGSTYNIPSTSSGGKANVGDFDNDGVVDIGFAGANRYIVLEYNSGPNTFSVKWLKAGLDDGSQRTGSTLYDFEGDGIAEVVYSEEEHLFILSGLDGSELTRIQSQAGTRVEYPLVADVNDDGQAEIIVTAQEGNGPGGFSGVDDWITVYKSANSSWVSSREVWNQHGYHVTNINDDMTIPQFQQDIFHPQFGGALNGFLVQTTYLDQGGEPTFAAPDLVVVSASVNQNCASSNNGLDISLTIRNDGDWKAPATTPITVYDADPYAGAANVIDTVHLPITLDVTEQTTLNTTVSDNGQDFTLYVLVNHNPFDPGTMDEVSTPLTAGTTETWVNECDYTNNSYSEAIINCNDEPVITDVNVMVDEDNTYTFSATDFSSQFTDADGETIDRIQITSLPSASEGILYLNGVAITANQEIDFADLGDITFEPVQDFFGMVTFGWNAHDGTEYSLSAANVNIDVQPINDPPVLTLDDDNSGGGADDDGYDVTYTEGDGAVDIVDSADTFGSDVDDTQMASATITVGGLQDGDSEELTIGGQTFPLGTDATLVATVGGTTFNISYASGVFTITNDGGGEMSLTDLSSLLTSVEYEHTDGDDPTGGNRTFSFVANDGDNNSTAVVSTVNVVPQNDAPVANNNPSNELVEDGSVDVNLVAGNDTDVDGTVDASTIILIDPSNAANTGNSGTPLVISGVGTYTVDASGNVNFVPETGFTGDASINYTVEDDGGATSNVATIGITVIAKPRITLGANPSVCEGTTSANLTYSATSGGSDQYSIDYDDASFTDITNATLPSSPITLTIPGGTTQGTYNATLTVRNSTNGYVSEDYAIAITVIDTPAVGATGNDPGSCGGSDGSIVISGVLDATTYNVSYTFNSTPVSTSITSGGTGNSLTIPNLVEGTYSNISVEASGCSSNTIASVVLSDPTPATIALGSSSNPTTCNGTDGTIQITGLAASTNYTLDYDENASAQSVAITSTAGGSYTLSGLSSGTYENFEVTSVGCTSNSLVGPVNLSDPSAPTITFDSDQDPASCSSTDGFIVLSSLTAGRDYDYSYTRNAVVTTGTLTADVDGKITISGLPAGTYTSVFVDDALTGCQSNVIPSLVLNPPDIVLGTTQNATTCSGTEGSFQITGLAASTTYDLDYSLDGTPVATASFTSNASGEHTVTGVGAGTYTNIRVTNSGCVSNSLSTTLSEPTPATITQGTVTNPTTCGGSDGSIQIAGLAVSSSYTVDYTDDGTPVSTTIGSDGSGNLLISGLDAGAYTNLSVERDNCTSNVIASINLSDPVLPTITLGTNPTECSGESSTDISYSATTGSPDRYSIDFDAAAEAEGFVDVTNAALPAGNIDISIATGTAGTYNATLTVTNSTTGCTSTGQAISVTVEANPAITLGSNPEVCQGEISANLPYSGATGSPDEYEIDFDATAEAQGFVDVAGISLGSSPITIAVPAGAAASTYNASIKVTNTTTGCESGNSAFTIVVDPKPSITLGASPEVCQGATTASLPFSATSGSPDQYTISFDATAQGQGFVDVTATSLPSSPVSITVPGAAAAGTYNATISVLDSSTGCVGDSESFTITVGSTPDITLGANPSVCMGETMADLTYSSVSGGANEYSVDFDATAEGQGFADVAGTALPASPISLTVPATAIAGTYNATLVVTNSTSGCVSTSKAITVTVNDNPAFTLGTSPAVCEGTTSADISYTISAGSPDTYSINYDAVAEGEGFVDVNDVALTASPISLTIPASAVVATYNATITLSNSTTGCSSTATAFTVTVNAEPTISLGADPEFCEGETTGSISYSATTGSPNLYSIDFADGSFTDITNQTITASSLAFSIPGGTTDGSYAATLTVSNSGTGCGSTSYNFNVVVKNTPTITSASSNPTTCTGTDGTITLQGLNDVVNYTISYNLDGSPVSTTANPTGGDIVISSLRAGAYTNIKVTEDGCDSNEIALITLSDPATATIAFVSESDPTTCGGSDGNIVISTGIAAVVSYTVEYDLNSSPVSTSIASNASGDITIGSLSAGQYENIMVTAAGCESNVLAGPFNLVDPTTPTIFYDNDENDPSSCSSTDGFLVVSGLVNGTSYDYQYTKDGAVVNMGSGGYIGPLVANASGKITITGLEAGTYTDISVEENGTGCVSNTILSIVLNPPDIVLGTTSDPTTCSGTDGTIQIEGLAASLPYDLDYDLNGTPATTASITSDASGEFTITGLAAGAYTNLTVTNSGCVSNALSTTLNDPTTPTISEGTHTDPATCGASDGVIQLTGLDASTSYGISYTVNSSTTSTTLSSNGAGVIEITGLAAGSYSNVTATLVGCESSPLAITLSDPMSPDFSLGDTEFEECIGTLSTTTTYTINTGSADTYSIDYDALANLHGYVDVVDAVLSGGNITFSIPASSEDRIYGAMVTVKNTSTNCTSNTVAVSIAMGVVPTVTLGTLPEVCEGTSAATLPYSSPIGSPDEYSIDYEDAAFTDVPFTAFPGTTEFPITIPAIGDGTYNATLLVQNTITGCVSEGIPFTITVNENPSVTLGTNPEVCLGETATAISYNGAVGSPDQYTIDFDATAEGQGFTDVVMSTLPASPIDIVVPGAATPSTYNATLVVSNSGNSCSSSALPFTVTVHAFPTEPTINAQVTGDATPVISGSADNGSNVTVIVGGATYSTVATGTGWSIDTGSDVPVAGSFNPNTNGVNEVQVISESNGCAISDTSSGELTIDTTAPIVPTVDGQVTNNSTPNITGTAEPGSTVTVVVGGATFIVTADASGIWTVDTSVAPDSGTFSPDVNGANEVQVTSTDGAGNNTVDVSTLELIIDTTAPVVPTVVSQTTNDTTPVIEGTAEAGSTVTVVVGGATYTTTADASGNWSIDTETETPTSGVFNPDVNGTNEVQVTSTDEAGNSTVDVTNLELTIDTTSPTIPTVVSQTTNDTTPVLTGTAEAGSTVTVVVGGATYVTTADGSGNWSIDTETAIPTSGTFNPNVNGQNEVQVTSTDAAGNSTVDVTNLELTIDTTAPQVPTVQSQVTNDVTPVLEGTAEPGSTVTVVVGGATYTTTADASGNWSIDTETAVPDSGTFNPDVNGTNEVQVTSTDAAGNSTTDVTNLELTIDTTAPVVPTVNSQITSDPTPVITGTAEPGSTVTVVVGGANYTTTADASGDWVINTETDTPTSGTFNPDTSGANEVQVTSTDEAGNTTSDATTLELIILAGDTDMDGIPDIEEDLDGDGDPTNNDSDMDGTPDFEDTDDDGDGVLTEDEDRNGDDDFNNDDCDADGTPDYLDSDSCDTDGDGILDEDEDTDGDGDPYNDDCDTDGIPNFQDTDPCDSDGDGLLDGEDTNEDGDPYDDDCDGDGIPNFQDADPCDTDGDGINDNDEDTDGDGDPTNDDCDGDGIANYKDPDPCDTDGDGLLDGEDSNQDGDPYNDDCDGDGIPNFQDADPCDTDGDGLNDEEEDTNDNGDPTDDDCDNDGIPNYQDSDVCDTDGDGINDSDEDTDGDGNLENDDCDGDGVPNYQDTDSCDTDGDGILDEDEDTDGDGNPYNDDCDMDGLPNFQDVDPCDSDGDGLNDGEDSDQDGDPYNDDCDGDGIPNFQDPDPCDTDGDGLTDQEEDTNEDGDPTNDDCDGDGIPNYQDTDVCDTDGDGINDDDEDTDGDGDPTNDDCDMDGIPNFQDTDPCDTDGDGINDDDEDTDGDGNPYNDDCDMDGIPNFQDTDPCDSDGDGLNDGEDSDQDGDPYNDDCDGDGIPNFQDPDPCDTDGDGLTDEEEDTNDDGDPTNDDCDMDGTPNYQDPDACDTDGDGINDNDEDSDGDGDPTNDDCDMDGTPNFQDTDPCDLDGDGILDDDEDTDGDGNPYNDDCDMDGTPNFLDSDPCDTDGDGLLDGEDSNQDGNPYNDDCDTDGIPNFLDPDPCDTDGDGLTDEEEDTNDDGDPTNDDCDMDGTPNYQDADGCDTDGDGINDSDEDTDGDGNPDNDDCDMDGTPNYQDTDPCDTDGDGLLDGEDTDGDGNPYNDDCDMDGIPNFLDSDPCDTDGDGINDNDEDTDGDGDPTNDDCDSDGVPNFQDPDPCDTDGDGINDDDEDTDGDGNPYNDDCDMDGTPNFQDTDPCDTDGDGINDDDEDTDGDGNPYNDDCDMDGTPNFQDPDPCDTDGDGINDDDEDTDGDGNPYNDDCDMDGTPNFQDTDPCDTDGDGINDDDEDSDGDGNPYNDDCDMDGTPNFQDTDPCDTDGDGINDEDEDTDGDGNPYNDDCDGDGTPNFQDPDPCDTDGDGINDDDEDTDGDGNPYNDDCDMDGIPNFQDSDPCDTDGDGINDDDEDTDGDGNPYNDDCDMDGTPNFQDPDVCDTDGDGINDDDEDSDGDGDPTNDDCDEDGIPNFQDPDPCDTDGDGINDDDEDTDGDGNPYNDDCDGDGTPNFQDPDPCDTDGDGINDDDEDTDGDGNPYNDDCDEDGIPNFQDPDPCDTDGDGINDDDEDTDGDGNPYNDDCDEDGIPNFQDPDPCDTDGDGINDDDEDTDGDGNPYNDDCDEDGIPNFQDPDPCDTDGDGINDDDEDTDGDGNPYNDDCDEDGIPNFQDPDPCDTDGDGINDDDEDSDGDGNPYNDDCDEDGIPNFQDPDPCDTDGDGVDDDDEDSDGDGNPYNDDCDGDGIPNFQDSDPCDTDGDGENDAEEDSDGDGNPYNDDCDDDGVPNFLDPDPCNAGVTPMPGFTPDGNAENDFFYIEGIENFPNNVVQIYNRWGNKLFEVKGYDNQNRVWRGEATIGIIPGQNQVPDGTYFYLIDLGNGEKPLSGFVVINR